MKKLLLIAICFITAMAFAQAPVIEGDTMLCPMGYGTATVTNNAYDTYQWQVKFYGETEFADVEGETSIEFTYDAYNYSLAEVRVKVTFGSDTLFSEAISIDSMVFLPIVFSTILDGDAEFDPTSESYLICPGGTITTKVELPYTIVQWYRDGQPVGTANDASYTISGPGMYYATAAPDDCPDSYQTTLPIYVEYNTDCDFGVQPVIAGDVMLCPNSNGTAGLLNNITYDSYQWQVRLYGEEEFTDIGGAASASFTYDTYNYSVTEIRVKVTMDGQTYYSNALSIDGMVFLPVFFFTETDGDAEFDANTQNYVMCEGGTVTNTVGMPYTIVQWYKDEVAIEGATEASYTITSPGLYYAIAAPAECPESTQTTLPTVVVMGSDCSLGTNNPIAKKDIILYPNPARNMVNIDLPENSGIENYSIIDLTGKIILSGKLSSTSGINISSLSAGTYLIKLTGTGAQTTKMLIRE